LSALTYSTTPNNISELVNTSDLIVVGTIGKIVQQKPFYGYKKDGTEKLLNKARKSSFMLSLPSFNFKINVIEIIMDDKKFPHNDKKTDIIYRTFISDVSGAVGVKDRRGKMIFFLSRNPDNKTYGISSIMHKIRLENKELFNCYLKFIQTYL
jgi:hypothetical protein